MSRIKIADLTKGAMVSPEDLNRITGGGRTIIQKIGNSTPGIVTGAGLGGGPHVKPASITDGTSRLMEEEGIYYF